MESCHKCGEKGMPIESNIDSDYTVITDWFECECGAEWVIDYKAIKSDHPSGFSNGDMLERRDY